MVIQKEDLEVTGYGGTSIFEETYGSGKRPHLVVVPD